MNTKGIVIFPANIKLAQERKYRSANVLLSVPPGTEGAKFNSEYNRHEVRAYVPVSGPLAEMAAALPRGAEVTIEYTGKSWVIPDSTLATESATRESPRASGAVQNAYVSVISSKSLEEVIDIGVNTIARIHEGIRERLPDLSDDGLASLTATVFINITRVFGIDFFGWASGGSQTVETETAQSIADHIVSVIENNRDDSAAAAPAIVDYLAGLCGVGKEKMSDVLKAMGWKGRDLINSESAFAIADSVKTFFSLLAEGAPEDTAYYAAKEIVDSTPIF